MFQAMTEFFLSNLPLFIAIGIACWVYYILLSAVLRKFVFRIPEKERDDALSRSEMSERRWFEKTILLHGNKIRVLCVVEHYMCFQCTAHGLSVRATYMSHGSPACDNHTPGIGLLRPLFVSSSQEWPRISH